MPSINSNYTKIPYYLTKKISEATGEEKDVINMSRGQAGFLPPQPVVNECRRLFEKPDKSLFKYEKTDGSLVLRKTIANWYKKEFGLDVSYDSIVITDGGTGGISLALRLLTNPGDEIMIPDPAYPYYILSSQFGLENRKILRVPIGSGPLTATKIENSLSDDTKLIILTSPHNPTGVVYKEGHLSEILTLAKKRDFFVLYDENHFPEVYDDAKHLPITLFDIDRQHSIGLGSLSRLGIQGMRIGWAIVPEKLKNKFSMAYSTQNLSVNTFSQRLAVFVLEEFNNLGFDLLFKEYHKKRDLFVNYLNKIPGFDCVMPEGTCYAFPNILQFLNQYRPEVTKKVMSELRSRNKSEEDIRFATEHNSMLMYYFLLYTIGVGGLPGITYGPASDDNIRLSFSIAYAEVEQAIKRFDKMINYI